MKNYLTSNTKLERDGILAWSIPAFRSKSGFKTCPSAGICAKGCYAKQGNFNFPSVAKALEERLKLTRSDDFVHILDAEIKRRKPKYIRIHAAGDFYSWEYYSRWESIIQSNPEVTFYAYTKQVRMFKTDNYEFPSNLILIYSLGGKDDSLVNPAVDRHARVFDSIDDLRTMGYIDASHSDLLALTTKHWVGLVYHGAKSRNAFNKAA